MATVAVIGTTLGTTGRAHAASDDVRAVERVQKLLGYVPANHRRYCSRADASTFADGNFGEPAALVYCAAPADHVASVVYALYDDPSEARAHYTQALPPGLPESDGTTTSCPSQSTWHFADAVDETAGSDACSIAPGPDGNDIATMSWTADDLGILALALNTEGDGAALKQWWNDGAGPLEQPESDAELADLSRSARNAVSTRLGNHTPAVVKSCTIRGADISDYTTEEPEWAWLPWLGGSVTCKTSGKGRVDLYQLAPDNAADFAAALRDYLTDDGSPGTKHPAACRNATALVRHGDKVGDVACWYYHQTLWAAWYDHDTGVVGAASIPGKTASELLTYLHRTKLT